MKPRMILFLTVCIVQIYVFSFKESIISVMRYESSSYSDKNQHQDHNRYENNDKNHNNTHNQTILIQKNGRNRKHHNCSNYKNENKKGSYNSHLNKNYRNSPQKSDNYDYKYREIQESISNTNINKDEFDNLRKQKGNFTDNENKEQESISNTTNVLNNADIQEENFKITKNYEHEKIHFYQENFNNSDPLNDNNNNEGENNYETDQKNIFYNTQNVQVNCADTCLEICINSYLGISETEECALNNCGCNKDESAIKIGNNLNKNKNKKGTILNFIIDLIIFLSLISFIVSIFMIVSNLLKNRENSQYGKYRELQNSINLDFSMELCENKISEGQIFETNYELLTTEVEDAENNEISIRHF